VVSNVETLLNVARAADGKPVTRKFVSINGAVKKPSSFWAPIGITFRELIEHAGGPTDADFGFFVSGIMMGKLSFDLDDVVTKTTCGLIVLPREHYLISRKDRTQQSMNRIGKSACDQCSYCTEFCPRYLLGYNVQPHKGDALAGIQFDGRGTVEPVGRAVLRVRLVHAVRVSRRFVSEGDVRPGQSRHAHSRQ
jgi:Na+-translocating ferredoxin:NAD+ oxidoreductase RnfC subunit